MRGCLLAAILAVLPGAARAGVSLIQVVQSQTSQGEDGLYGKTWITVSGKRMRMVSGFGRKVPNPEGRSSAEPARLVQVLDLGTTSLLRLDPAARTYEARGLREVAYADALQKRLRRGPPIFEVARSSVALEEDSVQRRHLGAQCRHFHIDVRLELKGPGGRRRDARMAQDLWVAPVAGELQAPLLDLIAFEAGYRARTGDFLTPLDYETYQTREAAAYLGLADGDIVAVIARVKEAFTGIPGYPLASAVSWWVEPDESEAAPAGRPPRRRKRPYAKPPEPRRRLVRVGPLGRIRFPSRTFKPINWDAMYRNVDRQIRRNRTWGEFPLGLLDPRRGTRPAVSYAEFTRELEGVIESLSEPDEPPAAPEGPKRRPAKPLPFYQIFAEMQELERVETLPPGHFEPPPGYRKIP